MSEFKKLLSECFAISGRLSAKRYSWFLSNVCIPILCTLILEWLIVDVWELANRLPHAIFAIKVTQSTFVAVFAIILPFLSARRLHDIGKSGWLCWFPLLTMLIPISGLWLLGTAFIWWLSFKDGDKGKNKYGEPPPDD